MSLLLRARPRYLVDVIAATTLAALALASAAMEGSEPTAGVTRSFDATAIALVAGMTAPLAFSRAYPRPAVVVSVVCAAIGTLLGYPVGIGPFGAVFALHLLAYGADHRTAIVAGALAGGVLLGSLVLAPGPVALVPVVGNGLFIAFAVAAGVLLRIRNDQRDALVERHRELAAAREAQVRSAVVEERMRIARDVHDAVGHALVAITLQSRVARRRLHRDPADAETAIGEIEGLARQALDETRAAVATIRGETGVDAGVATGAGPATTPGAGPSLADLDGLADALRGPGLEITCDLRLDGREPAPEHQQAAYRIVQEALSNAVQHAQPARMHIEVRATDEALTVEVTNDGASRAPLGGGSGLPGMRERAEHLGGTLTVGPIADSWRVFASLPARAGRQGMLA